MNLCVHMVAFSGEGVVTWQARGGANSETGRGYFKDIQRNIGLGGINMTVEKETRKNYKQPTLTVYGKLKDLTAGGSASKAESKGGSKA
jgi:hypothetical protein